MRAPTKSCASLPTTRSINLDILGERPHRVKRGKLKMGSVSTPRHNPRPDIRKPLRISNHPFVRAKNISPRRRPLVAPDRLSVSAPQHLWHGRNIFRPDVGHWWRVTACLFLPRNICGTGEIFFAPTLALGTPSPDHHPNRCQSSICSQTFSHTRSSIVGAKYFSPGRRPLVTPNRLTIPALHHFWHGRKIFRPYICHCYPAA